MARPRHNLNAIIRDAEFARRLNAACEDHPSIPDFGHGQQTFLHKSLGVSPEAVRKWCSGESRPRPKMMTRLAKLLGVDEAWLSLGIKPDGDPKERKARNAMADGAVNLVAGFIQMNGGHPAFPNDGDPRSEYVDLYTIIRGKQYAIHVALGREMGDGSYRFTLPLQYTDCTIIGVVPTGPMRCAFIHMATDLITTHKRRKGGYAEVDVERDGTNYVSGDDRWDRIRDFNKGL